MCTGYAARVTQTLARAAGVPDPDIEWQLADPPIFDNQVATLELSGRSGWVKFERTRPEDGNHPVLHLTAARRLS